MSYEILAPAKINLYLEVLGKMDNGFHELETVFHTISLADKLFFDKNNEGIVLTCSDNSLPVDERNIVYKAAVAFFEKANIPSAISIHIDKKIPHGGGLGGGSSDAASTLKALQDIFDNPLSEKNIFDIACDLGSDVPFFLLGDCAYAVGRGEKLQALPKINKTEITIIRPNFSISTPLVFKSLTEEERLVKKTKGYDYFVDKNLDSFLHNGLTDSACRLVPKLSKVLKRIEKLGLPCLLSGSGSCCFVLGHVDLEEYDCFRVYL